MVAVNYSEETTQEMIKAYTKNPTKETVDHLSKRFNKSVKSIIGKLSKEGIYRRESYKTKTGDKPITKDEIVASISDLLGLAPDNLEGLEKAPKITLKRLEKAVSG